MFPQNFDLPLNYSYKGTITIGTSKYKKFTFSL